MLYCSLINSQLSYGILIWGYEYHRLEKIQKRAIRIISNSKYNAHTEPIFKALDLFKIKDMLDLNSLKFYYKYLKNNLPAYFYSFKITTQGARHNHDTRHGDVIHIDHTRTCIGDKRVRIYIPSVINATPKFYNRKLQLLVSKVPLPTSINISSIDTLTHVPNHIVIFVVEIVIYIVKQL